MDQLSGGHICQKKNTDMEKRMTRKKKCRCSSTDLSFSASLPDDVRGSVYADSICAVKGSSDPFADFRKSIMEMVEEVGVRDWGEMEDLVYCYLVLNPSEVHGFIADAFLSVCSCMFSS